MCISVDISGPLLKSFHVLPVYPGTLTPAPGSSCTAGIYDLDSGRVRWLGKSPNARHERWSGQLRGSISMYSHPGVGRIWTTQEYTMVLSRVISQLATNFPYLKP